MQHNENLAFWDTPDDVIFDPNWLNDRQLFGAIKDTIDNLKIKELKRVKFKRVINGCVNGVTVSGYAARVTRAMRFIVVKDCYNTEGKNQAVLFLFKHSEYDQLISRCNSNPQILLDLLSSNDTRAIIDQHNERVQKELEQKLGLISEGGHQNYFPNFLLHSSFKLANKCITLNEFQFKILLQLNRALNQVRNGQPYFHVLTSGPPGSGKTTAALTVLTILINFVKEMEAMQESIPTMHNEKFQITFLVPTKYLKDKKEKELDDLLLANHLPRDVITVRTTLEQLELDYPNHDFLTKEDCLTWIKKRIKKFNSYDKQTSKAYKLNMDKRTIEMIYVEFCIIANCVDLLAYQNVGRKQSFFNKKTKELFWDWYIGFNDSLKPKSKDEKPKKVAGFTPFVINLNNMIIADEVHKFKPKELDSMFKHRIVSAMFDPDQIDRFDIDKKKYIKTIIKIQTGKKPVKIKLPFSYRVPFAVMCGVHQLQKCMKKKNKQLIEGTLDNNNPGKLRWLSDESTKDLINQMEANAQQPSPHVAIITRSECVLDVSKQYKTPLVFADKDVGGLEFETAIMIDLLGDQYDLKQLKEWNSKLRSYYQKKANNEEPETSIEEILSLYEPLVKPLFIAWTRVTKNLLIIESNPEVKKLTFLLDFLKEGVPNVDEPINIGDLFNAEVKENAEKIWNVIIEKLLEEDKISQAEKIFCTVFKMKKNDFDKKYPLNQVVKKQEERVKPEPSVTKQTQAGQPSASALPSKEKSSAKEASEPQTSGPKKGQNNTKKQTITKNQPKSKNEIMPSSPNVSLKNKNQGPVIKTAPTDTQKKVSTTTNLQSEITFHNFVTKDQVQNTINQYKDTANGKKLLRNAYLNEAKRDRLNIFKLMFELSGQWMTENLMNNHLEALYFAVVSGQAQIVEFLLNQEIEFVENQVTIKKPIQYNNKLVQGKSMLYLAVEKQHKAVVEILLTNKNNPANPNFKSKITKETSFTEVTPLYLAVEKRYYDIVEILLTNKANPNIPAETYEMIPNGTKKIGSIPALEKASIYCDEKMIDLLIDKGEGIDIDLRNSVGQTLFARAIAFERKDLMEILLAKGANIEALDNDGLNPLCTAIFKKNTNYINWLLEKGAKVNGSGGGVLPLSYAITYGHIDSIKLLLKKGADANIPNHEGNIPLIAAVCLNRFNFAKELVPYTDYELVKNWVKKETVNSITLLYLFDNIVTQQTPLYLAVIENNHDKVKKLLDAGQDANEKFDWDVTILHAASIHGNQSIIKLLIDAGADIKAKTVNGLTPLHLAAKHGHVELIDILSKSNDGKYDANLLNATTDCGKTPLHFAVLYQPDKKVSIKLITCGVNINAVDICGMTILGAAVYRKHLELVTDLLHEHKANINLQSKEFLLYTPLHIAASIGHIEGMELLLQEGADIEATDFENRTPLFVAILDCQCEAAAFLLKKGAQVNVKNTRGSTPLSMAVKTNNIELVNLLIANKADVNIADILDVTPLHLAATNGNVTLMNILLLNGANLEAVTKPGHTPLAAAVCAYQNQKEFIDDPITFLLEKKADIHAKQSKIGWTPLHAAVSLDPNKFNVKKVVQLLLSKGANIELGTEKGWTPLHQAVSNENISALDVLLENNANIEAVNSSNTPLSLAIQFEKNGIMEYLLEKRADIHAKKIIVDSTVIEIDSALFAAARFGNSWAFQRLLTIDGVDIHETNSEGETVFHLAARKGCMAIVDILMARGININAFNHKGHTPLIIAAMNRQIEIMKKLLAQTDREEKYRALPFLILPIEQKNQSIESEDIREKHTDEARVKNDGTADTVIELFFDQVDCFPEWSAKAARDGHYQILQIILQIYNHDPNTLSDNPTLLYLAAANGHMKVLQLLLEDERTNLDQEALHVATEKGHMQIVEFLLRHEKIDMNHVNKAGKTAFALANEQGNKEIIGLFQQKISTLNLKNFTIFNTGHHEKTVMPNLKQGQNTPVKKPNKIKKRNNKYRNKPKKLKK